MSNIYLKVTIVKKWPTRNFDFKCLNSSSPGKFLESSNSRRCLWIFKLLVATQKSRVLKQNCVCGFSIIFILKGIMTFLKSKSPCYLLNKNIKFNKNETESKMKNPTHSFREMNHLFHLIWELRIKSKAVMSCSSWKKEECICPKEFFLTFGFYLNL